MTKKVFVILAVLTLFMSVSAFAQGAGTTTTPTPGGGVRWGDGLRGELLDEAWMWAVP